MLQVFPQVPKSLPLQDWMALLSQVNVFSIGLGKDIGVGELKGIASQPVNDHYFPLVRCGILFENVGLWG